MSDQPFLLATRGSKLALWQAEATRTQLLAAQPSGDFRIEIIESSGDRDQLSDLTSFGRTGIFTAEVDHAVLSARAHCGVHSLKDMTTSLPEGLVLASALARGPVEDVLVTMDGRRLNDLPSGARVATGSVRRSAMLRRVRPDLQIVPIRGNVDTRLAKLARGEADALVMAHAGLMRLGLTAQISEVLPIERFLPAVGQGIVGLVCRSNDAATQRKLAGIGDEEAYAEALAERALLAALHGGCNAPVGARARVVESALSLRACVLRVDGSAALEEHIVGVAADAVLLGRTLAERLIAQGAREWIAQARKRP
jgi:hydroxymethylbilane synthase